jgi:serine/threonine protein kinase
MPKIGRYQIVGELGRGAMGVVYRAIDPNIGRTVALKTTLLEADAMERDELLRRFRNEAHAAGQMNHPNIVTIHDADEFNGLFYIAMEYLEGETLQDLMTEKHLISTEQIVEIAKQVAAGLDYAHSMKVVHRDIKPANIMISRQKVAKIMDFGISKSVGTLTRTGQILGTPYYMSPEQVMGLPLDGRSDLFSFGVVLYELATGARPFGGDTVATIIYKIINETPPPPCELQMEVHPGLSAVITRCLEKKPEDRYQNGAEIAADLENLSSLHNGEQPAIRPRSDTSLPQTQKIGIQQAAAVAPARSTDTRPIAVHAISEAARPDDRRPIGGTLPARRFSAKKPIMWASAAVLVVLVSALAALYNLRQRRHTQASEVGGGYSITVNVPAKPARRVRREVAEKHEAQNVHEPERRESARPASSPSSGIPEKVQTSPDHKTVAVYFTSNPAGASIQLDGESSREWVTPYAIADVAPGTHRVAFTKQGYSPEIRDLEIGQRDATYAVDLVPK